MSFNLAVILSETAQRSPGKPVAVFAGGQLSYGELDALSGRFAAGLEAAGLRPGDAVALQLPNIPQFLIAYFGILRAGCVVVPLNVMLKAPEIAFHLQDVRHAAVPAPGGAEQLRALAARLFAQRLDRARPLWEEWLLEGLEGGRWAIISKVHHCMVDGIGGTDLMTLVFDTARDAPLPGSAGGTRRASPADWASPAR